MSDTMTFTHQLATLESTGLIRLAATQPELEYLFRHALVQEAAYDSLVKQDRKRLHRAVGEALERRFPDQAASRELAPLLARHFDEAGDDRRASAYFARAGDAAAAVYANAEAVEHYTRAIGIARSTQAGDPLLRHLYLSLGRTLELSARDDRALLTYGEMEALARERGDRAMELAALLARATVYLKPVSVRDLEQGRSLTEQALALARELSDGAAQARSLWNLMQFYKWAGRVSEAKAYGEQALTLARALDLREQLAYVLNDISTIYGMASGEIRRAIAALDEAQQLWRELGILNMLADSLATSAQFHVMAGEYERALALSDEALRLSQTIGNLWNQSYSLYMIDLAYADRGEMGRAIETAEECLRLAQSAGFVPGVAQGAFGLALIYGYLGDLQRAREAARRADSLWSSMPLLASLGQALAASLHLRSGDRVEARRDLDQAGLNFAGNRLPEYATWLINLIESELLLAEGEYARVLTVTDKAVSLIRKTGIRLFLSDVFYFRGKALLALGRAEEARAAFVEARAEAEAIGSRRSLWQILAALSELEARDGHPAGAESMRRQARDIVHFIADHTGDPGLRRSFLDLPGVRHLMTDQRPPTTHH
jgi:tetratricopeptide (TPR) repeat protein